MTIVGAGPEAPSGTYNHPLRVVPSASKEMSCRMACLLELGDGGNVARELFQRRFHVVLVEVRVLEVAGQVGVVGREVEVPMAAQAEEDRARLASLLGGLGLLDHGADRV